MRRGIGFLIGILVVVVCLGAWTLWFYSTHEKVEVQVRMGMEGPARRDHHLGVKRYFEALEVSVREHRVLEQRDFEGADVAVVVLKGLKVHPWAADEVSEWMEAGGHLVLFASSEPDYEEFMLLNAFDARGDEAELDVERWPYHLGSITARGSWEDVPEGADYGATDLSREEERFVVLSAPRGKGRLTMIHGEDLLETWSLGYGEGSGQLWADILSMGEDWPEDALFFTRPAESLFDLSLPRRGWPALVALLFLGVAGVSRGRRFGPVIELSRHRQVRRADHVEAMGRFLWHHNEGELLIEATQRALLEALGRRRPSTRRMSVAEKGRQMAEELGEDKERVRLLLREGGGLMSREEFQQKIARLEGLRRRL